MKHIPKEVRARGNKKYFLLGRQDKKKVWLESPSWDCDWYWGFGYIEVFNRSNPDTSTDIQSHRHFEGSIIGKEEKYDSDKHAFVYSDYRHHLNERTDFDATTMTEKESWKLSELMSSAEIFRKMADALHTGGAHITDNPLQEMIKGEGAPTRKWINEKVLPAIFAEVEKLLSPAGA